MAAPIKVIIADDMQILRKGLKAILESDPDIKVVATAENGKEAFEKCRVYEPDVVLMDMRMPDYDGAYGILAIKEKMPNIKALVLTTFDDEETIGKALASGADGYILKEMEDDQVISAIKNVVSGVSVFGQSVYSVMRKQLQRGADAAGGDKDGHGVGSKMGNMSGNNAPKSMDSPYGNEASFTDREADILRLVAQGYDNKEIAKELFLAEGTVRNQVSHLLEKLALKDRTQLAVYAVKHGLDE